MRVEIRRIRADEGPLLMRVRLLSLLDAPYAFGGTYIDSIQRPADHWRARAEAAAVGGESAIFLAHAPAGVVGIAGGFQPEDTAEARHIFGVWVEPMFRRQGLARRLVETVIAWAETAGADKNELWVNETNVPAVGLYRSLGFEDTGNRQPLASDASVTEMKLVRPAGRGPSA